MINSYPLPEHKHNSSEHSCQNCFRWQLCALGKNRPDTLKGDYGLYGCIGHQLNKYCDEKKNKRLGEQRPIRAGWTLLRREIDLKTRTALVLYVMGCYPMAEAYRIAFNFKGKPASLGPIASRWWHDPAIQEYIEIFARCLSYEGYEVNPKILFY